MDLKEVVVTAAAVRDILVPGQSTETPIALTASMYVICWLVGLRSSKVFDGLGRFG